MKKLTKIFALILALAMTAALFVGCKKNAAVKLSVLTETFGEELYGIGFRNEDVAFGLKIQEAFETVAASDAGKAIEQKWFGEDVILTDTPFLEETEALPEDDSWTKIQEKGYFIVGLDASYPPMGFLDENNEIAGFDIDLAKEVATLLGVEVRFQPIDWDAKELELSSGNIDCIWNGMTITDERIENMYFTKAYLANEQIIVVKDGGGITDKASLAGKTVGTQAGSSSVDALEAAPEVADTFKELVTYADFVSALEDLRIGRIDAVVIDSVVGYYILAQQAG